MPIISCFKTLPALIRSLHSSNRNLCSSGRNALLPCCRYPEVFWTSVYLFVFIQISGIFFCCGIFIQLLCFICRALNLFNLWRILRPVYIFGDIFLGVFHHTADHFSDGNGHFSSIVNLIIPVSSCCWMWHVSRQNFPWFWYDAPHSCCRFSESCSRDRSPYRTLTPNTV